MTPFSACDVRGRRRAATSRIGDVAGGDRVSGFLTSSGSPQGGVPVSAVPLGVLGARSSAIFQSLSNKSSTTVGATRLPAKWRQLRRLPELSPICAGAETFRRWNYSHWFRGNSPKYRFSLAKTLGMGGAKLKCFLATIKFPSIG